MAEAIRRFHSRSQRLRRGQPPIRRQLHLDKDIKSLMVLGEINSTGDYTQHTAYCRDYHRPASFSPAKMASAPKRMPAMRCKIRCAQGESTEVEHQCCSLARTRMMPTHSREPQSRNRVSEASSFLQVRLLEKSVSRILAWFCWPKWRKGRGHREEYSSSYGEPLRRDAHGSLRLNAAQS